MIQVFLSGLFVLAAPGYLLLVCLPGRIDLRARSRRDLVARLADSAALSVALSALLGMVFLLAGIRFSRQALVIFYALCAAGILAAWAWRRRGALGRPAPGIIGRRFGQGMLAVLGFTALLAWRFYQARDLALPAWVDPVHHTLIVRKMMEYGGVPWDLQPYLDIPFYYHYGFHLVTALFSSLAGLQAWEGVLWLGQVINAGVALSVYRLGMAFAPAAGENEGTARQEWNTARARAILAALLVGFALQMPAYYLTWGRYTLLTGLLLLGPCLAAAYELWKDPADLGAGVRYVILLAGIFLTHYLVVVLAGLFLAVLWIWSLPRAAGRRGASVWPEIPWVLALGGLLAVLLTAPWLWRALNYSAAAAQVQVVVSPDSGFAQTTSAQYWNYLVFLMGPRHNYILMGAAAAGLLFSLRRADLRPLAAWTLLLAFLSQPWGLRIGPFRPDLFLIVLFFPASLFLADLLVSSSQAFSLVYHPRAGKVVLALAALLVLAWGARETRNVVNRSTVLATQFDVAALDWVRVNTPPDARFFINSVPWQYNLFRGVDGGFWLLPYAGRASLVPTSMYGYGSRETIQAVSGLARRAEKITGCTPDFWGLVRDAALTHVYLRQGAGTLQPEMLDGCSRLRQVYASGGVAIYEILFP